MTWQGTQSEDVMSPILAMEKNAHRPSALCVIQNKTFTQKIAPKEPNSNSNSNPNPSHKIAPVILRRVDQTAALARALVHRLDNVDCLLCVGHCPVDLVVVTRAEIDHHVLVAVEKHRCAWVVQLVHSVEVVDF